MSIRDEEIGADLTLVEGDDGIWSSFEATHTCAPRDLRSLYERERARADAAEARCEELRWAEVDSRARASSLKWQLNKSRSKLSEAVEETKEVRRTAKDALSLQAEVTRLEKLLSEAGVEPSKRGDNIFLSARSWQAWPSSDRCGPQTPEQAAARRPRRTATEPYPPAQAITSACHGAQWPHRADDVWSPCASPTSVSPGSVVWPNGGRRMWLQSRWPTRQHARSGPCWPMTGRNRRTSPASPG